MSWVNRSTLQTPNGSSARWYEIAKQAIFYKQEYGGCIFSLRDTNKWRESKSRDKIRICGNFDYYNNENLDYKTNNEGQ